MRSTSEQGNVATLGSGCVRQKRYSVSVQRSLPPLEVRNVKVCVLDNATLETTKDFTIGGGIDGLVDKMLVHRHTV